MANTEQSLIERVGYEAAAVLDASDALAAAQSPFERMRAADLMYNAIWLYGVAANQPGSQLAAGRRGRALLELCGAANYFVSTQPGFSGDDSLLVKNLLWNAGLRNPQQDRVIATMRRILTSTSGAIIPNRLLPPDSERRTSPENLARVLEGHPNTFHYEIHNLAVSPDMWRFILAEFRPEVEAE